MTRVNVMVTQLRERAISLTLINRERLKEFKPRYIPVSRAAMQPLKDFLAKWKRLGIAEEGTGLTATSMMSVPKKQNEIHWVSDLRPRNAITDKDYATLPNMEMIIEEVANCLQKPNGVVSLLDMSNSYHQILCDPESWQYNCINTPFGTFQIKVMLQGDCNAPATMMRAMTTTFREFIGEFVYVYLDDIVIFSNSYEEHVTHLEKVCEALKSQ